MRILAGDIRLKLNSALDSVRDPFSRSREKVPDEVEADEGGAGEGAMAPLRRL